MVVLAKDEGVEVMTIDQESWWAGFKAGFESDRVYTVAIAVSAFCAGFMWGIIYD